MTPTHKELVWFRIANAGHPPGFYPFKDRFLKRFATRDGYDVQTIQHHCWNCEGCGEYSPGVLCRSCDGSGIYRTSENWLERWDLHGTIYHRPVDPIPHWQRPGQVKGEIEGRIVHAPVTSRAALRAYWRLLLRFEPMNFYHEIIGRIKGRALHCRHKLVFRLMRLRDKLDLFPSTPTDDCPF